MAGTKSFGAHTRKKARPFGQIRQDKTQKRKKPLAISKYCITFAISKSTSDEIRESWS